MTKTNRKTKSTPTAFNLNDCNGRWKWKVKKSTPPKKLNLKDWRIFKQAVEWTPGNRIRILTYLEHRRIPKKFHQEIFDWDMTA